MVLEPFYVAWKKSQKSHNSTVLPRCPSVTNSPSVSQKSGFLVNFCNKGRLKMPPSFFKTVFDVDLGSAVGMTVSIYARIIFGNIRAPA
jgi:hypothetical protein